MQRRQVRVLEISVAELDRPPFGVVVQIIGEADTPQMVAALQHAGYSADQAKSIARSLGYEVPEEAAASTVQA